MNSTQRNLSTASPDNVYLHLIIKFGLPAAIPIKYPASANRIIRENRRFMSWRRLRKELFPLYTNTIIDHNFNTMMDVTT